MKNVTKLSFGIIIAISSSGAYSIVTPVHTASDLTEQYYNTSANCGGDNKPAFLCSGVMLRGTLPSKEYHSWDPSPSSVQSGGISFSYLRKDSTFSKLAYGYNNGFIFYPHNNTPQGKYQFEVLCSFPIDADSFNRADNGCGAHMKYPKTSLACQSLKIWTAAAWKNHYTSISTNRHLHQCGFNIRETVNNNAIYFIESLKARALISAETLNEQNEIRLATWRQDNAKQLPVQAFFYVNSGLNNARYDQKDYYSQTHQFVPIIRLILPKSSAGDAKFNYIDSDQAVKP